MPTGLRYVDAVRLLGGSGPLVQAADNALGAALSVATAGGSQVALSLFDAKAEAVRLGDAALRGLAERVRGLGRYERSRRLQAAHGVLVVTAFFEALDECLEAARVGSPEFGRDDQLMLAGAAAGDGHWPARVLDADIPAPAAERSADRLVSDLTDWFAATAGRTLDHLTGLSAWDRADGRARRALGESLRARLPARAAGRYQDGALRLAGEIPEFAIWLQRLDARSTARGLASLEAALLRVTSHRDPARHRAALAAVYHAELDRPILGGDSGDLVMPSLAAAYIDPAVRVKAATTGARPAEEAWWDTPPRGDLAGLLAAYLTTPEAAEAPMLLLGQPGAGKSSLTRVLAARLPAADFLVVRVALREVSAEAPIQDQVEQAIRAAIGENVAWPDLARDAGGAMPVILLDGFDELLQATGVHQSDYLQRVAAFQQREATLGRPVAVMVTSRVAVADRARLPAGGLAVRLEPFDEDQVARWLEIWNSANAARLAQAGRRTLPLPVVRRFPDLAEQPLLLLMLALYDAAGNALQDGGETFDTGQLYERLLANFAEREARRVHPGHSDAEMPALVEQELLRLSVVAFAMFHRLRLWVTEQELDHDLAGLGLRPARSAGAADFRAPLTAGQEAVGRFFFIQRAQAVRDGKTLQAYEFLHATFGEYLVARLTVQALRDAVARSSAGTLALRADRADDELLQSLLGFTPLTARTTVLPFVTALLDGPDRAANRVWLVSRLRTALTRPEYVPRAYQPVEKRIDFWMATYSFNLTLLALACGEPLRASELFVHATDPAGWLRTAALQWRAAVPGGMWLGALEEIEVTRGWTEHGQRDMTLVAGVRDSIAQEVELPWSHVNGPVWEWTSFVRFDSFPEALRSMDLSSNLSDDLLRHAVEPLMRAMPESITNLAHHAPTDVESVAHSLVHLWTTSALDQDPEQVLRAYQRAVVAVTGQKWLTSTTAMEPMASTAGVILRCLHVDATRLNPGDVVGLIWEIYLSVPFVPDAELRLLALECLLGETMPAFAPRDDLVKHTLPGLTNEIRRWPATWALRLLAVLSRASDIDGFGEAVGEIDQLLASPSVVAELRGDPGLAERVAAARGRLDRTPDGPVS